MAISWASTVEKGSPGRGTAQAKAHVWEHSQARVLLEPTTGGGWGQGSPGKVAQVTSQWSFLSFPLSPLIAKIKLQADPCFVPRASWGQVIHPAKQTCIIAHEGSSTSLSAAWELEPRWWQRRPEDSTPINVSAEKTWLPPRKVLNMGTASLTILSLYFKKTDDAKPGKRLGEGEKQAELGLHGGWPSGAEAASSNNP